MVETSNEVKRPETIPDYTGNCVQNHRNLEGFGVPHYCQPQKDRSILHPFLGVTIMIYNINPGLMMFFDWWCERDSKKVLICFICIKIFMLTFIVIINELIIHVINWVHEWTKLILGWRLTWHGWQVVGVAIGKPRVQYSVLYFFQPWL